MRTALDMIREAAIPEEDLTYIESFVAPGLLDRLKCRMGELRPAFHIEIIDKPDGPMPTPRLVANFSDADYTAPGSEPALLMPDEVAELCEQVSAIVGHPFNYVLANWYRDGRDYTGWHPDKVAAHVPGTRIGIVSLGAVRAFSLRDSASRARIADLALAEGSLALMSLNLQTYTEHAILQTDEAVDSRISLTLRCVKR